MARLYLVLSQLALIVLGGVLLVSPNLLIGDNGFQIGARLMAMMLALAVLALATPTLIAALRGDRGALRYLSGGQVLFHAPMAAVFGFNIGAFDYAFFTTGQTVFVWMAGWILIFAAPMVFVWMTSRD